MKFDIDNVKNNKLELLDCQIELILKSLEFYCYTYEFIYPRSKKSKTLEENLRISMVTDTYNQILSQCNNSKKDFERQQKTLKKFA